jgi:hypothetical protein
MAEPLARDSEPPDVLLIASHDDGVAVRLREALEARGRRAMFLDGPTAGRLFTLRGGQVSTVVEPNIPMFIRPSAWWHVDTLDSADAKFLRAECFAAFWAATALSTAAVINRSGPHGQTYRLTAATIGGMTDASSPSSFEILVSGPEQIDRDEDRMWGEDLDFRTGPIASMRPDAPLRARSVQTDARYEIVTIVGDRSFPATRDSRTLEDELGPRSVALAKSAGAHFVAVSWEVSKSSAIPVRLNAGPEEWELRYVWSDVVAALCDDLS